MKRFGVFGLFLALCVFTTPVQADVCNDSITLKVELNESDPATPVTVLEGGTLRYDVSASGDGADGKAYRVMLDFVIKVRVVGVWTTFTRPRTSVNVNSTLRAIQENRRLVVGRNTEEVCMSVYAHPAGGQCDVPDVNAARELGFVEKCFLPLIE